MKKIKIYHNERCSKSRETLKLIQATEFEKEVVCYLDTPPSIAELDGLLKMLGLEPDQIVRKGEDRYEELGLDTNSPQTREDWLKLLVANPILIERPIVTDGKTAVIGRPPETVKRLF